MKRFFFFVFPLSLTLIITSCEDSSGKFSEPFFTDKTVNTALIDIVKTAKDSTCTNTANAYYDLTPVKFPEILNFVQDSLLKNSENRSLIDSFLAQINRTVKLASPNISQAFNTHLTDYIFPEPSKLLDKTHPNSSPAVDYFKKTSLSSVLYTTRPYIESMLVEQNAGRSWDSIVNTYKTMHAENDYANLNTFNLTTYTTAQSVEVAFTLAALEEVKMRTDSNYRKTAAIKNLLRVLD